MVDSRKQYTIAFYSPFADTHNSLADLGDTRVVQQHVARLEVAVHDLRVHVQTRSDMQAPRHGFDAVRVYVQNRWRRHVRTCQEGQGRVAPTPSAQRHGAHVGVEVGEAARNVGGPAEHQAQAVRRGVCGGSGEGRVLTYRSPDGYRTPVCRRPWKQWHNMRASGPSVSATSGSLTRTHAPS